MMKGGTTVKLSAEVKGELIFDGVDNAALSQCCSSIKQEEKGVGVVDGVGKDVHHLLDQFFIVVI